MFVNFDFTNKQVEKYLSSAKRDLEIAQNSDIPEVKFRFSYDTLVKLAICIAASENLRVKSRKGHHILLLEKLAEVLKDNEIENIGNAMRTKRNHDLYDGGVFISAKDASEYLAYTESVYDKAEKLIIEKIGKML